MTFVLGAPDSSSTEKCSGWLHPAPLSCEWPVHLEYDTGACVCAAALACCSFLSFQLKEIIVLLHMLVYFIIFHCN